MRTKWHRLESVLVASACSEQLLLSFHRLKSVPLSSSFKAFDRKREVRSALVADDRVNFVENQSSRSFQHSTSTIAGQQEYKATPAW